MSCMLAKELNNIEEIDNYINWFASEKWDGFRAIWDGEKLISRNGKEYHLPDWYREILPKGVKIDGELWIDRYNFQEMGKVRKKEASAGDWLNVKYKLYDIPSIDDIFKNRLLKLKELVKVIESNWNESRTKLPEPFNKLKCPIIYTTQTQIKSKDQLINMYKKVLSMDGEGLIIKDPESVYEYKRSNSMLKIKPEYDAEGIIIDYKGGKSGTKNEGKLGAFICHPLLNFGDNHVIDKGKLIHLSGMDDNIRENYLNTHPVGTIVTFKYSGITENGLPRFPRYDRIRTDININYSENIVENRNYIITILNGFKEYYLVNNDRYKSSAYDKAIKSLKSNITNDIELTPKNIRNLDNIGKSIYEKIISLINNKTCEGIDKINKTDPRNQFLKISGIGPQCANKLIDAGFKNIEDLRGCDKIEEYLNIQQQIGLKYHEEISKKIPRSEIDKHSNYLNNILSSIDKTANLIITGSYRRGEELCGDIDVLINTNDSDIFKSFITKLNESGYLTEHLSYGNKKYNGICRLNKKGINRRIDILLTKPNEAAFALLHFTGSNNFNKQLRKYCNDRGLSISEHGLKNIKDNKKIDKIFKCEKDIFDYLKLNYLKPDERK